ncbi:MAG: ABC transporter permease [Oscillospiraceae bacterium]|jgi:ABC-2 type transport system permease protein|nr:ABC transporter permease [Oscillospiraceae bacterium]
MRANGWKQVFKFTYLQMIKSKAYIISTIVIAVCMLIMAVGINFLPALMAGGFGGGAEGENVEGGEGGDNTSEGAFFGISKLYVSDRSGIEPAPDFDYFLEMGIELIPIPESDIETKTAQIHASLDAEALVEIIKVKGGYNILASRPEFEGRINADNCRSVLAFMSNTVWMSHLISIGVPEESISEVSAYVTTQVTIAGEAPRSEIAAIIANIALPTISALILFMFIIMYGQLTAQAIATEKTSRVMETLLTSVRPMAIILGKVLGMGLASFTQFFALVASGVLISAAVAPFGALGQVFGSVEIPVDDVEMQMVQTAFEEAFVGFNAMSVVWIIIVFLLGFLFYSLIAGLFGASINRIEDLQAALQPMSLISVLGFMMAYLAPIFNMDSGEINFIQRISYYVPISSPFALPAAIISGEMNAAGIFISVLVLAVFCVLMLLFVSRVYEAIVMHTGNRIKFGIMLKMAKKK